MPKPRTEKEIFDELAALCASPGYAHALAYLCFRDQVVGYRDELRGEDYAKLFSFNRLIRTEIATLLGLMVRVPLDLTMPSQETLGQYIQKSDALLKELHEAMMEESAEDFQAAANDLSLNPFASAKAMREPIFYGAESAYSFQYRDLAPQKYGLDAGWMKANKGFSIAEANAVVKAIMAFFHTNLTTTLKRLRSLPKEEWTLLDGFSFTIDDILEDSGLPRDTVKAILDAFTLKSHNPSFTALHEFNEVNAYPLLKADENRCLLFQYVTLTEALYDTPFFWMLADNAYKDKASENRGKFTEEFAADRLAGVFGKAQVHCNVDIWQSKAKKLGEIDVLVLFADRAIVLQAKSKRLTLAARKGNDLQLQSDFKGAVQDACDQAYSCSEGLLSNTVCITNAKGEEIKLPHAIKVVHPICLVSDHYPSLSFQALQFLKTKPASPQIKLPLVCDVFFLDTVTEMLNTPLQCLSYLELRALAGNNILLSHEHTALGYHLRQNLWMGEADFIQLHDDISADLDIAMAARRDGIDGQRIPRGILTFMEGTPVGKIVGDIEQSQSTTSIAIGIQLLKLSSDTVRDLNAIIKEQASRAAADGRLHDATLNLAETKSGITIHCTAKSHLLAALPLKEYCERRKYAMRAESWYGLVLEPGTGKLRFGIVLEQPWKADPNMEEKAKNLSPGHSPSALPSLLRPRPAVPKQPGRNQPCTCGSGRKFKHCCGRSS